MSLVVYLLLALPLVVYLLCVVYLMCCVCTCVPAAGRASSCVSVVCLYLCTCCWPCLSIWPSLVFMRSWTVWISVLTSSLVASSWFSSLLISGSQRQPFRGAWARRKHRVKVNTRQEVAPSSDLAVAEFPFSPPRFPWPSLLALAAGPRPLLPCAVVPSGWSAPPTQLRPHRPTHDRKWRSERHSEGQYSL